MTLMNVSETNRQALLFSLLTLVVLLFQSAGISAQVRVDENPASADQIRQLDELVDSLSVQREARETLRRNISAAAADDLPELQENLDELNRDIRETRAAIQQIAVGSVDLDLFTEQESELNWRDELTQLMLPLMQNLKRITEKPRRIEALRARISQATERRQTAELAAQNISATLAAVEDADTRQTLVALRQGWIDQAAEFGREIDLAQVQLASLQAGDESMWVQIKEALIAFIQGRGLTLLLALFAGVAVYYLAKLVAIVFTRRQKGEDAKTARTRERIVQYALKALKTLLILIAVMVVFYLRGDILLMALSFLIAGALALSLRNTIPRFLDELKLLLNLGSVREDERVMYQGLPWKVTQLNMHSVLKNPEITGVLRLPMQEMMSLSSRPAGNEPWFPASKGDYIVLEDERLLQVVKLTPEHVLLESLAGTSTMIPTADFYNMVFENLSRSPTYFVSSVFGIGYSHQGDSVKVIPHRLKTALELELANSDLAEHVVSVSAELQEAGASSLDFWLGVKMKTEAATAYFRIKRLIQQVCVSTCTTENWDIPFPQLTLHNS